MSLLGRVFTISRNVTRSRRLFDRCRQLQSDTQTRVNSLYNINRTISTTIGLRLGEFERQSPKSPEDVVNVTVVDRDGVEMVMKGKVGDNLMLLSQMWDVDIEGACEASLACCTCHVYVDEPYFSQLDEAEMAEEDLLDMAPFLKENSRLGCQIILRKDMEGMTIRLPVGTRNMRVDGKGPGEDASDTV